MRGKSLLKVQNDLKKSIRHKFDVAPSESKNKAFARKPLMKTDNSVRVTQGV